MKHVQERLKEVFENTVENGPKYKDSLEKIKYYNIFCKAASNESLYKLMGNNLCMFNCTYEDTDSVMMLFSIPINNEEQAGSKGIAERVMEIIAEVERCFTTIDNVKSEEVKEDKFVYLTIIKKIGDK
jgi:hypothetical protein